MQKFSEKYQQWLVDLPQMFRQARDQEVNKLLRIQEVMKAYVKAGSDLTADELQLFVETFIRQSEKSQVEGEIPSLWSEALWVELALVTDKTQVEWQELKADLAHRGLYQQGEQVGMGLFCCEQCQQCQAYYHPTELAACLSCGGGLFSREGLPV
jgi:polyhydroxyalkanoate synthesis regulator phasin